MKPQQRNNLPAHGCYGTLFYLPRKKTVILRSQDDRHLADNLKPYSAQGFVGHYFAIVTLAIFDCFKRRSNITFNTTHEVM